VISEGEEPFEVTRSLPVRLQRARVVFRENFPALAIATAALIVVVVAELIPGGRLQNIFAVCGVFGLAAAVILPTSRQPTPGEPLADALGVRAWRMTILGVGVFGALTTQSWFRSGTAIAGGDITPPIGTAWLGRIFGTFGWSGSNLGAPANNSTQLPFASVDWIIHLCGGSEVLAQRVWFTLLVSGIMMAAAALARSLKMSPTAGVVAAVFYFFNPMTMSQVGVYDNYLTAMILVPALAAVVISFGSGRIRLWQVCVAFVLAAPLVGFTESNPPLVGMLAVTTFVSPMLVWVRFGRKDVRRAFRGLFIGGALLIAAGTYWILPSINTIGSVASSTLSSLSSWAYTESRSTLANGLWLNTTWGWSFSEYYPYAADFSRFPLDLVMPLVPLVAFIGLTLQRASANLGRSFIRLRALLTLGALVIVLLSTGTRPPGNLLFDPLYHLPYGWLLQEPGRFLIVAALCYALLGGLLVQQVRMICVQRRPKALRHSPLMQITGPQWVAGAVLVIAFASSFPLWTGAIVPGPRDELPSSHVRVPADWTSTAAYLNSSNSPHGSLLVLPVDDFYQMPYTWYYGNDEFISNLLRRSVVVPNDQGYENVSTELIRAVHLESSAIVAGHWKEAGRLLSAIGTPIVLVRGDINSHFPGRSIVSPATLALMLHQDPEMKRIHRDGELSLYELKTSFRGPFTNFATVNTSTPNLRVLALVPSHTVLSTETARAGHVAFYQMPSSTWHLDHGFFSTKLSLPTGWKYKVVSLDDTSKSGGSVSLLRSSKHSDYVAHVLVPASPNLISDGNFSPADWGSVGNCDAVRAVTSRRSLRALSIPNVGPEGKPALELVASVDSACVAKTLSWHGGPIQLSLWERTLTGAPARICMWEEPTGRCALLPPIPPGMGWRRYAIDFRPASGVTIVRLFLYADSNDHDELSKELYSDVTVRSVTSVPHVLVVGTPIGRPSPYRIDVIRTGYSRQWVGRAGATHVKVDGLRNGWIVTGDFEKRIDPENTATKGEFVEGMALSVLMVGFASVLWLLDGKRLLRIAKILRRDPRQ
jgi:hypothetical protein